jgi:hypothetical protein
MMTARVLPLVALVVLLALAGAASARPIGTGSDGRPNILVVMTDDEAASDVGVMPNVRMLLARRERRLRTPSTPSPSAARRGPRSSPASTPTTTASRATSGLTAGTE